MLWSVVGSPLELGGVLCKLVDGWMDGLAGEVVVWVEGLRAFHGYCYLGGLKD